MKANRTKALVNCARWNYEHAEKARKNNDHELADRLEKQSNDLYYQALKAAEWPSS